MHWDAFTTCSVISGIALAACALFARDISIGGRLTALGFGAAFFAYGLWVGHQTSGIFVFPVEVFIIPIGGVLYLVVSWWGDDSPPDNRPRPTATSRMAPAPPKPTSVPVTASITIPPSASAPVADYDHQPSATEGPSSHLPDTI